MHRRQLLALIAVFALALTAGCLGNEIPEEDLATNATYDWETEVDAEITIDDANWIGANEFQAVYQVSNQSTIEFYREGIARDRAMQIRAIKFQYPNGTVVDHEAMTVDTTEERTIVTLPATDGRFGMTATHSSKQLRLEPYVEGSYRLLLPPNHEAADFLLGDVVPSDYEVTTSGDRTIITWSEAESTILVRYYAERDRLLFWGFLAGASLIGLVGYLYFRRQIAQLIGWREQQGLDIDEDYDDDDRRPPPGMR